MPEIRVPRWWMVLGDPGMKAVEDPFRDVLERMPMSHRELARQLDVSQPTVSRWARGQSTPDYPTIIKAFEIIEERVKALETAATKCRTSIDLAEKALDLDKQFARDRDPKLGRKKEAAVDQLWAMVEDKEWWQEWEEHMSR